MTLKGLIITVVIVFLVLALHTSLQTGAPTLDILSTTIETLVDLVAAVAAIL